MNNEAVGDGKFRGTLKQLNRACYVFFLKTPCKEVISDSLEVWNPEYNVSGVAGKEVQVVREIVLTLKCYFFAIGSARVWYVHLL